MNTRMLAKLIRNRSDILWILKLRESGTLERIRMMNAKCPSYVWRTRLTYLFFSTSYLESELFLLSSEIDFLLEEISIHELTELL